MATTINAYSVSLGLDASQYISASGLSRSATRDLKKDIESARTPAENYARDIDRLTDALNRGAISEGTYQRLVGSAAAKHKTASASIADYALKVGAAYLTFQTLQSGIRSVIDTGVEFITHLKDTQDKIDSVADAAGKLGVSYNELKGLRFAAQEAGGVEASAVDAGIKKMQIAISKGSAAFAELGLDSGKLKTAGAVEAFNQIADAFGKISSHSDKLRLSQEIFGKGGTELVSTLESGRGAIAESVGFMEKFGGLNDAQVLAVQASNDAWDRIGKVVDGISAKLAGEAANAMSLIAQEILVVADGAENLDRTMQLIVNTSAAYVGILKDLGELFFIPLSDGAFKLGSGIEFAERVIAQRQEMERNAASKVEERRLNLEKTIAEERERLEAEADKTDEARWIDRMVQEEKARHEMQQRLASQALKSANDHFKRERDNARRLRDDIAKGPQSIEAGSSEYVKYMAEQANAAIAASMGLEKPLPTEQEILAEAVRQSEMMAAAAEKESQQVELLQKLLDKKPEIGRIR